MKFYGVGRWKLTGKKMIINPANPGTSEEDARAKSKASAEKYSDFYFLNIVIEAPGPNEAKDLLNGK